MNEMSKMVLRKSCVSIADTETIEEVFIITNYCAAQFHRVGRQAAVRMMPESQALRTARA